MTPGADWDHRDEVVYLDQGTSGGEGRKGWSDGPVDEGPQFTDEHPRPVKRWTEWY